MSDEIYWNLPEMIRQMTMIVGDLDPLDEALGVPPPNVDGGLAEDVITSIAAAGGYAAAQYSSSVRILGGITVDDLEDTSLTQEDIRQQMVRLGQGWAE